MEDKEKAGDSKSSYDALRNMFLQPPVYLPPPLSQSLEGGIIPGVLPGQGAASSLMFNPFLPGMPFLPYRDFAYLPFPAAAAALEGRSGQSPSSDGAAAASAASFWTGLYPFVTDPFMAEAMKMNLSPYLPDNKDGKKSANGKDVKKSTFLKTDVKDLKRKPERSSSTHSESSSSSHDRQTPGSKSPATHVSSSPLRKEHGGPPPLIKTPPLAHERKRPKLEPSDEALDFSSKPKYIDSKKSLLPRIDKDKIREEKKVRSAPNFGDVEWLSNPDSSPKKSARDNDAQFLTDPNSVLRGEALQVRIAQYNVSQLRSKLDMDMDENCTARIEPEFSDLGSYREGKEKRLERGEGLSAFERVEQKMGRDSVIVSRNEPKSFSERMSDIARRHAAANDLKDPGIDMKGFSKPGLDLRGMSFPRHADLGLDLKIPLRSSAEPSSVSKKSPIESKPIDRDSIPEKKEDQMTLKDSVDNILDSILNTYDDSDKSCEKSSAIHSKNDCDSEISKDTTSEKEDKSSSNSEKRSPVPCNDSKETVESNKQKEEDVGKMSGGEMHGLSSSFLPLSEVLSTAINSEFARSQTSSKPPISTSLFSQTSGDYSQQSDDNPYMSIENIINRLENDDDDEKDDDSVKDSKLSGAFLANSLCIGSTPESSTSEIGDSKTVVCDSAPNSVNNALLSESKLANVNTAQSKQSDITTGQNHQKCDETKTKLVLVKDPRNGYSVKGTAESVSMEQKEGIVTSAVVEKVVNSVMGESGVENGIS